MWRHVWFVAAKDARFMFREKSTLIWVFLMPLLFFYFIGTLTSGLSGSLPSGKQTLHCRHERETGFLAEHLERRLAENRFAVARAGGGQSEAADDAADEADYVLASGIFGLTPNGDPAFVDAMLARMAALARRGVSVNFLSAWTPNPPDPRSWYADPAETLARARRLTRNVVLRHDYKPNDFTLYLRHGAPGEPA